MFLGSVDNYVTHYAPCSMLIIRNNSNADLNSTGDRQGQKFVLPLLDLGMIL